MSPAFTIEADPARCLSDIEALEEQVAATTGWLNASHARLVDLPAAARAGDLLVQGDVHGPQQWLMWKAGLSRNHAQQVVDVAARVGELPELDRAVRQGLLSLDQAAVVARRCPVGYDQDVVALAVNATVQQLYKALSRYNFDEPKSDGLTGPSADDDASAEPKPEPVAERRQFSFWYDDDGDLHFGGIIPADEGALFESALAAAREDLFRRQHPDLDPDSADARTARRDITWTDALAALNTGYLMAGEAAYGGNLIDRFCTVVHLEADPCDPEGPPIAGLHLGSRLPTWLRHYLLCDGDLMPAWETKGTPVAYGRKQRIVPPKVRILVEHRDRGCRVPGCEQILWLHIHHIIHWEHLGETEPENLICLCQKHHRQHHLGLLPITGTAADLIVRDRWGRRMEPVGRPQRVVVPADLITHTEATEAGIDPHDYVHPPGDQLQTKWIDFALNLERPPEREPCGSGGAGGSLGAAVAIE